MTHLFLVEFGDHRGELGLNVECLGSSYVGLLFGTLVTRKGGGKPILVEENLEGFSGLDVKDMAAGFVDANVGCIYLCFQSPSESPQAKAQT